MILIRHGAWSDRSSEYSPIIDKKSLYLIQPRYVGMKAIWPFTTARATNIAHTTSIRAGYNASLSKWILYEFKDPSEISTPHRLSHEPENIDHNPWTRFLRETEIVMVSYELPGYFAVDGLVCSSIDILLEREQLLVIPNVDTSYQRQFLKLFSDTVLDNGATKSK